MELPGFVFILVGLMMVGFSIYFNIVQGNLKMTLFIVVGVALIVWGFIKMKTK